MCPICSNTLTPIVYGMIDDRHLALHKAGKIVLAGYKDRYSERYRSYCTNCLEGSDIAVSIVD